MRGLKASQPGNRRSNLVPGTRAHRTEFRDGLAVPGNDEAFPLLDSRQKLGEVLSGFVRAYFHGADADPGVPVSTPGTTRPATPRPQRTFSE